ncbi:MAG: type II CRISPR-associated endonuclease Cas1, partial [Bacteroidales bacterium]|nr:type II CRISPR-associated endonuclease Cas1 [Bacteroidales bacterium]
MIKRTLYFGNPAYLSMKDEQLVVKLPAVEKCDDLPLPFKEKAATTIPIEDVGIVILDHKQITVTQMLIERLLENNCALITCDEQRMPCGLMLPLESNIIQHERFITQIEASLPLRKQLWQQTITRKIENQAAVLKRYAHCETGNMMKWAENVKSGDSENLEARAAAYYWANLFPQLPDFTRKRDGDAPNPLLNYGYAILRAIVARALVAGGLLPTLGIHHHNRYNAYCLADDIMEPYRPYVDEKVIQIMDQFSQYEELTKEIKTELLQIPVIEVQIDDKRSPLMVAV